MAMNLYDLTPPIKWRAGSVGETELFFDCCQCGDKEPLIHGVIGTSPSYESLAIRQIRPGVFNPAMFCKSCWKDELAKHGYTPLSEAEPSHGNHQKDPAHV